MKNENVFLLIIIIISFLQTDHHVERGCVKDLKEKYDECMRETESCVICDIDNCNIDDHSVGHRMTSTILLNIFAIFVLFSYY